MNKSKIKKLAERAKQILDELEEVKELYAELDAITMELKNSNTSKHGIEVVDNFANKNTVFRPAAVKRFELKKVV